MTAKTYKFSAFKKETVEHYIATAKDLRFLPASRIKIDRYQSETLVEFVLIEKRGDSWFFGPKNAAKHGIIILEIIN
jgi:hypothetical protein